MERLSTIDSRSDRKRAAHLRFLGGSLLVFTRFLVDFGSILGGFQAVRASAQDLGGFWASAQGLYIAVSAAFPAWVGTYTTNDKSGLQSRKTAAPGGHKTAPEEYPPERSQKKSRQRSDRQRLLYLLCLFQDLGQDHERQNQHTQNSQFFTPPYIIISAKAFNSAVIVSGVFAYFSSHTGKWCDK